MEKMKIGILTGGGDCPGLNAVIYGALLKAFRQKIKDVEIIGLLKGWKLFSFPKEQLTPEVVEKYTQKLDIGELDDLHTKGGTILYTSRTNPFKELAKIANSKEKELKAQQIGKEMAEKFDKIGIDALISIGGDDTQGVAAAMYKYGNAKVVGCPKTIDNDLRGTDFTFGFFSGAQLASNNLDNLTTTAHSHQRIFIVEIMGRDAGWLTLYSGLSSGSDIILIPETPFDFEQNVINILKARVDAGYTHHIIACSEGAYPNEKSIQTDFKTISPETIKNLPKDVFGNPLLNKLNMANVIEKELSLRNDLKEYFEQRDLNYEVRSVVLGHTMRAGTPNVFDRILGLRYGWHAMDYIINGNYGKMTALKGTEIIPVDLVEGSQKSLIPINSDLVKIRNALTDVRHLSKQKLNR